jgi:hypothetical protein
MIMLVIEEVALLVYLLIPFIEAELEHATNIIVVAVQDVQLMETGVNGIAPIIAQHGLIENVRMD